MVNVKCIAGQGSCRPAHQGGRTAFFTSLCIILTIFIINYCLRSPNAAAQLRPGGTDGCGEDVPG